jgi:phospholipase C
MNRSTRAKAAVVAGLAVLALAVVAAQVSAGATAAPLGKVKHIVVIYEENHSFDNL